MFTPRTTRGAVGKNKVFEGMRDKSQAKGLERLTPGGKETGEENKTVRQKNDVFHVFRGRKGLPKILLPEKKNTLQK